MSFREVPAIKYDKDIERLLKYYKRSYSLLVKDILRLLETDSHIDLVNQKASITRQLSLILKENDELVEPIIAELITDSFQRGQAEALLSLGNAKTLSEAKKGIGFTLLATERMNALIQDTFEDLLALTNRTNVKIKKIIRDVVGETMRLNAVKSTGVATNKKQIIEQLLKQGFTKRVTKDFKGVTDSAGRRWALDKYVGMVVRTKLQQAHIEGVITQSIAEGSDLAVISSHGARDNCKMYEGVVISLTGATKGYNTYSELRGGRDIFHPNCRHHISPIYSVSDLPKALQEKHNKQVENLKNKK